MKQERLKSAANAESERICSSLKCLKAYFISTGNNRLHALILVHIHKNILDKINLADVANEFVDSRKQIFTHISQNFSLFKIKLTPSKK